MYRHVLVPTDGSTRSKRAAAEARRLGEANDARLTILTVVDEVDSGSLDALGADGAELALQDVQRRKGKARLEETIAEIEPTSIDVETEIVAGVPHRAICDFVESAGIDLVVLGAAGKDSLLDSLLGSTTERVTQLCDVPVLVV